MIEIFFKLITHEALDEWNERTVAVFVLILVLDFARRLIGRTQFKFELSSVAKKWIQHKAERNGGTAVIANPHPKLSVLLEEVVDELRDHRKENDEQFRSLTQENDEQFRKLKKELEEDLRENQKSLRQDHAQCLERHSSQLDTLLERLNVLESRK